MYHVTFPEQSNRASWVFIGQITDLDDNPIDLSLCSMVFEISGGINKWPTSRLVASTANGKLTIIDIGKFRWFFTKEEMGGLCAGQYDTGLTLTNDDGTQTVQLSVGPLPIVDGVVGSP
jgi:hypothetical protein